MSANGAANADVSGESGARRSVTEAVARLRREMTSGGDYAVVDVADLRVVLDHLEGLRWVSARTRAR